LEPEDHRYVFLVACERKFLCEKKEIPPLPTEAIEGSKLWHNGTCRGINASDLEKNLKTTIIIERGCTEIIAKAARNATERNDIRTGMVKLEPTVK